MSDFKSITEPQASLSRLLSSPIQKLLVIRTGAMGDLLHASASVQVLSQINPAVEVHWLTTELYEPLVRQFTGVSKVWTLPKSNNSFQTLSTLQSLAKVLRQEGIDGIANLHPNLKTMLLSVLTLGSKMADGNRLAIYHKEKLEMKATEKRLVRRRHAAQDFYLPIRRLMQLPPKNLGDLLPQLSLAAPSMFASHNLVPQSLTPQKKGPRIAIIPGVGQKRPNRQWPLSSWVELIQSVDSHRRHIAQPPITWVLIGGPDETALSKGLIQSLHGHAQPVLGQQNPPLNIENRCGQLSILQTAEVLSQCHLVLGGDTGPLHLAAAVGTPIVSLFAPTDLKRTGPIGRQSIKILTPAESKACWPCERSVCYGGKKDIVNCTGDILVPQVVSAVLSLLS